MDGIVSKAEPAIAPATKPGSQFRQRFALTCAVLGCAGWLLTLFSMGTYDASEKLARHFHALVNVLIIATCGGLSTILSVIALLLTTQSHGGPQTDVRKMGFYLSWLGLLLGVIVLVSQLPGAMAHLN